MARRPVAGERYRHFKGNIYIVDTVAIHTETEERLVIFHKEDEEQVSFAVPLKMFMEVLDTRKYPRAKQKYRYELIKEVQEERVEGVSHSLLDFLDADSYEKKLELLMGMKQDLDDSMIDAMAVSLDISIEGGTLDERYAALKESLIMMEKYEGNRLRNWR